jgi:hypothetical protein
MKDEFRKTHKQDSRHTDSYSDIKFEEELENIFSGEEDDEDDEIDSLFSDLDSNIMSNEAKEDSQKEDTVIEEDIKPDVEYLEKMEAKLKDPGMLLVWYYGTSHYEM